MMSDCVKLPLDFEKPSTDRLYELKICRVKPSCLDDYLQLTKDKYHLRKAHSKLIGLWLTDVGAVDETVELWEYDSLSHRASVEAALGADLTWELEYTSTAHHHLSCRHNQLLALPWGSVASEPIAEGGVYQLCSLQARPDSSVGRLYLKKFAALTKLHKELITERKVGKLIAVFTTQIGSCDTVYQLWNYKNVDDILVVKKALENEPSYKDLDIFTVTTRLMQPLQHVSPLL